MARRKLSEHRTGPGTRDLPPAPAPDLPAPTVLPCTDRSRLMLGWTRCMRERWLEYHAPPTGYGIRRKAESIPLATGIFFARGQAAIIQTRQAGFTGDNLQKEYRRVISAEVSAYKRRVKKRGFLDVEGKEEATRIMLEQASLIEGLLWAFALVVVDKLFEEYTVICVEQEEDLVLDCTCWLGDGVGTVEDHEKRQCRGFQFPQRPDLILQRRSDLSLHYWETKTTGYQDSPRWKKQWPDNPQLMVGGLGTEKRLGVEINFATILGVVKGTRYASKDPFTGEKGKGPRMQDSVFCYAYHRPAQPPFAEEDWKYAYDYVGEDGKGYRATESKGYRKVKVWEVWDQARGGIEAWVRALPIEVLQAQFVILGPFPNPRKLLPQYLRGIVATEQRVREGVWAVHDAGEAHGWDLGNPEFLKVLDHHFPQSFKCVNDYGIECQFVKICKGGITDPIGSGYFEPRRPHHTRELVQVLSRGIALPEDQDEGGEEEGGS